MFGNSNSPLRTSKICLVLVLVFACGGVTGVALSRRQTAQASTTRINASWKEMTIKRMRQELQLTPVQSEAIEQALDDFTMYYQTLQAQMDEVRAHGKDRIQNVLNPDQKKKFEQMVSDLKDKQIR